MKISPMIGGTVLIICAIIGHNSIPYVISQANSLTSPLGGSIVCDTNTGNNCMAENLVKTTSELSTFSLGLIGLLLVGFGALTNKGKKENLRTAKTEDPTKKILKDLFA